MESLTYNNDTPRICLLGATGTGKSTLGNVLCGEKYFITSSSKDSVTSEPIQKEAVWFGGKGSKEAFFCVDTCGFGDSEGRDDSQLQVLVKDLKEFKYVNFFLVMLNSTQPRFDQQIKKMFQKLKDVFGTGVFGHMMVVFTRWDHSQKGQKLRIRQRFSESLRKSEINEYFKAELGYDTDRNPIPCAFVDSNSFEDSFCEEEELAILQEQFEKIKIFCMKGNKFVTEELKKYVPPPKISSPPRPVHTERKYVSSTKPTQKTDNSSCKLI